MNLPFLCWYNAFICLVLGVLILMATGMPDSSWANYQTFKIVLILAFMFLVVGVYLHQKPQDHWAHQSRPMLVVGWVMATLLTVLALLVALPI